MFESYLGESILARASAAKKIAVKFYDPRHYTSSARAGKTAKKKDTQIDDRPYGGGPGMVMQAEPILRAVTAAVGKKKHVEILVTAAGGEKFTNTLAHTVTKTAKHVVIICGRYEGIDARVTAALGAREVSIGDYVLTGGELPALVMIDAMARQIPGVLGREESIEENRISSHEMYTRPEILKWKGKEYKVPEVLLSGDHKKIEEWKKKK